MRLDATVERLAALARAVVVSAALAAALARPDAILAAVGLIDVEREVAQSRGALADIDAVNCGKCGPEPSVAALVVRWGPRRRHRAGSRVVDHPSSPPPIETYRDHHHDNHYQHRHRHHQLDGSPPPP